MATNIVGKEFFQSENGKIVGVLSVDENRVATIKFFGDLEKTISSEERRQAVTEILDKAQEFSDLNTLYFIVYEHKIK